MSSDFVCKDCGWRSEVVNAIFHIEMAASYLHDGKSYRQHSLRVVSYTLTENMDVAVTVCPNCENTGTIAECYDQIFICSNCRKDVDDSGGFCSYNSGTYCSRCYKKFTMSCEGCVEASACELRKANLSKTERIKDAIKIKDAEPDTYSGMSAELRNSLNLDSAGMEIHTADDNPDRSTSRSYARDQSRMASGSGNLWDTPPLTINTEDDDFLEDEDE